MGRLWLSRAGMRASWLPAVSFVLKAWVINFAFSFSFAYFPTKTASEIKFVGGTPARGINLLQNAFFCGLFTPVFSCYFVKKLVRDGRLAAIPEQELTEAGVRCLVHRNPCLNTPHCGCLMALLVGLPSVLPWASAESPARRCMRHSLVSRVRWGGCPS